MATSKFRGKVVKKRVSKGSKSERDAVLLEDDAGHEHVLRRKGGNPFADDVLDSLVGKKIRCKGVQTGNTVIMTEWDEDCD